MMEWSLPRERAGRAPQASRHSNGAEAVLGAGGGELVGPGNGLVVRLAPVADVAGGFGVEGGLGPVAGAGTVSIRVLLEHALTMAATPAPPASRISRRRLTSSGRPSCRPGGTVSMTDTIEARSSMAVLKRKAIGLGKTHSATPAGRSHPACALHKLFVACVRICRIPVCHWRTVSCLLDIGSCDCSVAGGMGEVYLAQHPRLPLFSD